jgi:hypothetical protein
MATQAGAGDKTKPSYESATYKAMAAETRIVRDVSAGIGAVRARGTQYLPKHPIEDIGDYAVRLNQAVLFNGVQRTLEGLAGMVFRQDPSASEDMNKQILAHLENIDNTGRHVDVFSRAVFVDALEAGHAGILVDVPAVDAPPGRRLMQSEEAALGVRPYWCHVQKEDMLSPRTTVIAGKTVLTQLVLREVTTEEDGRFGEKEVTRYRVLSRDLAGTVKWEVLKIDAEKDEVVTVAGPGTVTNQSEIPFVVVYGKRTGFMQSRPPLLDLAETNLAHYRLLADHLYAMHLANIPVGVLTGVDPDTEIEVGPNAWLKLPQGATFAWEAHDGANFSENREQLREFKADMAAMGLSLLQVETRQAETATATRMNRTEQDSALAAMARSLQDALEMALMFHGNFMRIDSPGTIEINRDFENQPMTPEEIREWRESVAAGQYSLDTMWAVMEKRGALPDDFDPEIERERIATGGLGLEPAPVEVVEVVAEEEAA